MVFGNQLTGLSLRPIIPHIQRIFWRGLKNPSLHIQLGFGARVLWVGTHWLHHLWLKLAVKTGRWTGSRVPGGRRIRREFWWCWRHSSFSRCTSLKTRQWKMTHWNPLSQCISYWTCGDIPACYVSLEDVVGRLEVLCRFFLEPCHFCWGWNVWVETWRNIGVFECQRSVYVYICGISWRVK